jgi:peroxisome-assembly ATPase
VIITSIPILQLSSKNQARRFISLIDALYEARCRLICLAEAEPQDLFFPQRAEEGPKQLHIDNVDVLLAEAVGETRDIYRPNVSSYGSPNMAEDPNSVETTSSSAPALETLSMFSGKDEQFAFKRALSRLVEMTSESYGREERWTPLPHAARKWEGLGNPDALPTSEDTIPLGKVAFEDTSYDFAEEAAYENQVSANVSQRPEAPRLREEHIWGVREDWGERSGLWGQGAAAHGSSRRRPRN